MTNAADVANGKQTDRSECANATHDERMAAIIAGDDRDPFSYLGMHQNNDGRVVMRVFHPGATSV